jgi:hypothetical protein
MAKIIITLPFPLPTWNRILGMNRWQRKKLRDWVHWAVGVVVNGDEITASELKYYDGLIRPKKMSRLRGRKTKNRVPQRQIKKRRLS